MTIHRTAMGKAVDMSALSSRNEKTRAVGNMNVNARGDIIDSNNRIIQDNTQRVKGNYKNTVTHSTGDNGLVPDHLVPGKHHEPEVEVQEAQEVLDLSNEEQEFFEELDNEIVEEKEEKKK